MKPEWSSPEMTRVAEAIRDWTGLTFPAIRVRDVESTIEREMKRRQMTGVADFLQLLHDEAPVRDALVADLTIGETYFGRDPAQFALLRERLLPELLAQREPGREVRVWSAGCASGEEPYSVALLFDELEALDRAYIVGTDISRPRLLDAQRGIYSKWSLRASSEAFRARWFRPRGRYYELAPRIRERVDFRYLNLAEDHFPSLSAGIWGMDIILCRNVLIYFDPPTVARVARRLLASLSDNGWLILGASDPAIGEMVECDVVLTDAGVAYRRPGAAGAADLRRAPRVNVQFDPGAAPAPPAEQPTPVEEPPQFDAAPAPAAADPPAAAVERDPDAEVLAAYAEREFDRAAALAEESADLLSAAGWIVWVRSLANQGCLDDAATTAARAVERHGPSAELLYLNAVLLLQSGQAAEAAALIRRALYLDRDMIVAHMTLAEAQRRAGNVEAARRALRNAAALLSALPADATVPASDGEAAGRLAELVRVKLGLLTEAA